MRFVTSFRPSRRGASTRTVVIIVSIIAAVGAVAVVACCGVFGWMIYGVSQEAPAAQAAAEGFFADLQAGRVDEAYAGTTAGFKAGMSLEQFRGLVAAFPAMKTHTSRTVQLGTINRGTGGDVAIFKVALQAPAGATNCTLTLTKEGGAWKVHHLSIP